MRRIFFILTAALWTTGAAAQSQPPRVTARFVPDSIAIGDRFELEITVDKDQLQLVDFPVFEGGKLTDQIEIVEELPVDTLSHEGRRMRLGKRYRLTTFEEGVHPVGRFPTLYIDKNIVDTLHSVDSLVLQVGTFEIDTTTMTIRDVKPTMGAPLRFGEISGWLGWGLLALLAIALIIWRIVSLRRNLTMFGKPKPVDPPHVAAIRALEILHNQKLWQNNKHKQYYTRLTDIVREYLDGRYGIPAMEMTTDETLEELARWEIPAAHFANLRDMLSMADLVKFAKFVPDDDENETAYTHAYYFVENTKPNEIEAAPADPDEQLKEVER